MERVLFYKIFIKYNRRKRVGRKGRKKSVENSERKEGSEGGFSEIECG